MSWMRTNSLNHYMKNRILRIYPAFILAYLLSVFVLGPLVGAAPWRWMAETIFRLIALQSPKIYPGQLSGLHYPDLNGSMWTIAYEFRCYLLVAAFGITGLLRRRWLILSMTAFGVLTLIAVTFPTIRAPIDTLGSHQRLNQIIGVPWYNIRLITTFLVGVCFYLFREELFQWLDARAALLAGACALAFLFRDPHLAEAGLITVGAACLFWVALKADIGLLRAVNNRWDVSYGVYLYGWPIATAIRWFDRGVPPWMLAAGSLLLAYLAGAASWWGVEKWAKAFSRLRSSPELARQSATAAATP
jgi:peptidoglycan/LPS O-acetylase OafA/YrhL